MNTCPSRRSIARSLGTVGLALAVVLSTTACGEVETEGFRPKPSTLALTKKTEPDEVEDFDALSESEEPSDAPQIEQSPPPPVVPLPTFLYPNGFEVALTAPGTVIPFGEPATVATSDTEGRLLVWSIVAHDGVFVPRENVELLEPERAVNVSHFFCYAYDITFLGAVSKPIYDPMVLKGVPDVVNTAVTPPTMVPANFDGAVAKSLVGGADNACGIPDISKLPTTESMLEVGYPYARGAVGVVDTGAAPEDTASSVSYEFDEGIPGVTEAPLKPAPIRWN